jgi:hypothetical protein
MFIAISLVIKKIIPERADIVLEKPMNLSGISLGTERLSFFAMARRPKIMLPGIGGPMSFFAYTF